MRICDLLNLTEDIKTAIHTPLRYEKNVYAENTPEGIIVYGDDIEGGYLDQDGGEAGGSFGFTANLTTGEILDLDYEEYNENNNSFADTDGMKEIAAYTLDDFKKEYGTTWDQVKNELHGGIEIGQGN